MPPRQVYLPSVGWKSNFLSLPFQPSLSQARGTMGALRDPYLLPTDMEAFTVSRRVLVISGIDWRLRVLAATVIFLVSLSSQAGVILNRDGTALVGEIREQDTILQYSMGGGSMGISKAAIVWFTASDDVKSLLDAGRLAEAQGNRLIAKRLYQLSASKEPQNRSAATTALRDLDRSGGSVPTASVSPSSTAASDTGDARVWTNTQGQRMTAELVEFDGSTVSLKRGGRIMKVPLSALSQQDQTFLAGRTAPPPVPAKEVKTGHFRDYAITTKFCKTTRDYFAESVPRKVYRAYKRGKESLAAVHWNDTPPEECAEYKDGTCAVYVPDTYDGTTPFGVYLHINPGNRGGVLHPSVLKELKMIGVSPHDTPNGSPDWNRIIRAMDSLATVKNDFLVDDKRVVVGGLSGGGHIGFFCHMLYPDEFVGAISHAAQSYLPGMDNRGTHFPGLSIADTKSGRRMTNKWAVVSGDKDQNYQEILSTGKLWEKNRFQYRFFDIPGMGHTTASPQVFKEVMQWIGVVD